MTQSLALFSDAIGRLVLSAAPHLTAIRIGPNRHITGLLWGNDTIITSDQALPALDTYTVVLPTRVLAPARSEPRDPGGNLATLHLDTPVQGVDPEIVVAPVGSIAILLGADVDASPTVRLTVIHRFMRTADGLAPVLDLPAADFESGGPVLDVQGRLIGIAALGPNGERMAVPGGVIGRLLLAQGAATASVVPHELTPALIPSSRRGWLGVALQPTTVPHHLVQRAGQSSGRMVVSITKGGPADVAGLRVGDVLLAVNGTSTSGPQALRAFLGSERVGSVVETKLLRDGNVVTTQLTVAYQPA